MGETDITCNVSPCVVQLIPPTPNPLFNLSASDALTVGGAIIAAWAIGYTFRVVIQLIKDLSKSTDSEE